MDGLQEFWSQSDAIGRSVALLLLAMSVGTWVVILWKAWLLRRALRGLAGATHAFWQAPDLAGGQERLRSLDPEQLLAPLAAAAAQPITRGTLEEAGSAQAQHTRRLRDALHGVLGRLQRGQVFLASVGATAPFIGLFGTVWGIYHALLGISDAGALSIDKVAGPVGESLIMTASGLAVAIPAVLAYNLFSKWLGQCEAELEGFAQDLLDLALRRAD
ncbi:MotA/TolQ/ExbB proton channel family protein [Ideonella dechloratans]|uniref:Biopolymer transport protein ExbB n=1 Tax=Ideonella dechloratans TaxID=36863 RepID=A0A643FA28_IDEDE|nr:MotA/TolQ/ExbB proton channel family protein [Ideonella dechloratans]KAB0578189.1 MotA/TolQ/ExbB proton channel family protein [Ideonella dechloratans]UFU09841.1 MotA/TolQ/ExbB proton channel family protein [Ideonella dechloratans]